MSQLKEDLEGAVAILEERGWCQGSYRAADGRVCAKGALRTAILSNWYGHSGIQWFTDEPLAVRYQAAQRALSSAITASNLLTDTDMGLLCLIAHFNDLDSTSAEDVKLVFKRAIEACEEDA